jgi:hypothetical protein
LLRDGPLIEEGDTSRGLMKPPLSRAVFANIAVNYPPWLS